MTDYNKLINATGLWRKTSAQGREYFVGRLGGMKVLIFENRDCHGDTDPTHQMFFAEAGQQPTGKQAGSN
ncbi:MAG: hypothetical protein H6905_06910 [Hyphomicrobiales bacterium]|nr:hypothetical protein [Hyphomicrobiales bacterium]